MMRNSSSTIDLFGPSPKNWTLDIFLITREFTIWCKDNQRWKKCYNCNAPWIPSHKWKQKRLYLCEINNSDNDNEEQTCYISTYDIGTNNLSDKSKCHKHESRIQIKNTTPTFFLVIMIMISQSWSLIVLRLH